jgi:hypothetical protein
MDFCVVFSLNVRCLNDAGARERISPNHVLEFGREVWKCMECSRRVCFGRFLLLSGPLHWAAVLGRGLDDVMGALFDSVRIAYWFLREHFHLGQWRRYTKNVSINRSSAMERIKASIWSLNGVRLESRIADKWRYERADGAHSIFRIKGSKSGSPPCVLRETIQDPAKVSLRFWMDNDCILCLLSVCLTLNDYAFKFGSPAPHQSTRSYE